MKNKTTKKPVRKVERETDILRSICDYLTLKKHFFWRANNIPAYDTERKTFRAMPKYSMHGTPDLIVIKDGFFIGLEVKNAKGRLSTAQKAFAKLCKDTGAEYYVVRSIDDVKEIGL
ncbi:MAG: VRR-NUC domain-containing protein [Candidatus Poseidoniales archaeon]|jgi:hypothetical protein